MKRIIESNYIAYEAKMCYFNNCSPLLPYKVLHLSDSHECHYNVEGMTKLSSYVKADGGLSSEQIHKLLRNVGKAVQVCKAYMLEVTHLQLKIEDIYYDGNDFGVVYLPANSQMTVHEVFAEFYDGLQKAVSDEEEAVYEKMHQMRLALDEQSFSLGQFVKEILLDEVAVHG